MNNTPEQAAPNPFRHLAIWANPIVWKNFKSRMRTQAAFQCLLVFIISAFMTLLIYTGFGRFDSSPVQAARIGILPLLILQAIILMLSGTGRVTAGIIHERVTGTLDYTRLTPMSSMTKVTGYLFGLPVREYILFAITIPFMAFLLIRGQIPLSVIVPVYTVFFTSVILYHLIGTVFGLVLKEWRMSVLLTQGVVVLINLVLPAFSNLGLPFLQFLTIRPVVAAKIGPYLSDNFEFQLPESLFSSNVAFFDWSLSTTAFTLLLQGALIFTLGLMVYRKWESAFNHSMGKRYSLGFFAGLQVFSIGTLWPNLTGSAPSAGRQGLLPEEYTAEALASSLPLLFCFFTLICAIWLLYVITPTRDEYRAGIVRERKLRQAGLPGRGLFDDKAGSLVAATFFSVVTVFCILFIQERLRAAGAYPDLSFFSPDYLKLALCAILIIFYFYVGLEYLEMQKLAILMLCLWLVPILLAILAVVAFDVERNWTYIAGLSPLALLVLATTGLTGMEEDLADYAVLNGAFWTGFGFSLLVTLILGANLALFKKKTRQEIEQR